MQEESAHSGVARDCVRSYYEVGVGRGKALCAGRERCLVGDGRAGRNDKRAK